MSLQRKLRLLRACGEAIEWVGQRDFANAWAECERPDWMLWLVGKMADEGGWPDKKKVVLLAADIAESVLPIFEKEYPKDGRPRNAIEAARGWADGKVALKDVRAAAAYAAAAAADAYAAAYAAAAAAAAAAAYAAADADADAAAAAAAYAAADADADAAAADAAADAAAYAADAAADAAAAADFRHSLAKERRKLADLIRNRLTVPKELP